MAHYFKIEKGTHVNTIEIKANTYTMAYLGAALKLPESEEIIEVREITQ